MVGAASCKLDIVLDAPIKDLVINEFTAIITVNTEHREWQGLVDMDDLFLDPAMSVVKQRTDFSPAGTHIGNGQGLAKLAFSACPAMASD